MPLMKQQTEYYSQFCLDCACIFVSDKKHTRCWSCNSNNTINTFLERNKNEIKKKQNQ